MKTLLGDNDIPPFWVEQPDSSSDLLFLSDHADRVLPKALGTLGLDAAELSRHIAYDIGIYGVTAEIARSLSATYIFQRYSRLVIDCNRKPGKPQSVMTESDCTFIPGNASLSHDDIAAREREILWPYQNRIEAELARREAEGRRTVIFAMHSCTDMLRRNGVHRPWEISVIASKDWRLGTPLVDLLRAETGFCVGVNEPYNVSMDMDFTVPVHCEGKGIPYVEIEIRQDLIGDEAGQAEWAKVLTDLFPRAVAAARLSGA
jgi:predicted N-formylglutamate amidohydrolase